VVPCESDGFVSDGSRVTGVGGGLGVGLTNFLSRKCPLVKKPRVEMVRDRD